MQCSSAEAGWRKRLQSSRGASGCREAAKALAQRAARKGLSNGVDHLVSLYKGRILVRKVVHAIGLHEAGDSIGGANHHIPGPSRVPAWLPSQTHPRLEVVDSSVGVVARADGWDTGLQIEIDVLAVVRR